MPKDIPEDFRVTLLKNAPNPYGVLRSKGKSVLTPFQKNILIFNVSTDFLLATGEPPLCMAVNVVFALRNALNSARRDAGISDYYQIGQF